MLLERADLVIAAVGVVPAADWARETVLGVVWVGQVSWGVVWVVEAAEQEGEAWSDGVRGGRLQGQRKCCLVYIWCLIFLSLGGRESLS